MTPAPLQLTQALRQPAYRPAAYAVWLRLNNCHTCFGDDALNRDNTRPLPFYAEPAQGRWTVTVSRTAALKPGDVVASIDGVPVETWISPMRQVVGQSSLRARDHLVFTRRFMFPVRFVVGLADGRRVPVSRDGASGPRVGRTQVEQVTVTRRGDGVVVVAIPSFDAPQSEADVMTRP